MKKYIALIVTLIFVFSLAGCKGNKLNGQDTLPNSTDAPITITEKMNDSSQQDDLIKEVERIVQYPQEVSVCVEEPFYEDENYIYSFGTPMSEDTIVTYTDGSKQNVKEALEDGNIVITDLDTHGIQYYANPKHIHKIVDMTERGEYEAENAPEEFYRDDNYVYYFDSVKSQYVIIWYWADEPKQNVKDALAEGKIKITDLDHFGISYHIEPI